ncbi:MAG: hypothetical protein ACKOJF_27450 [Planctomycetaceae bacterium]
MVRGHRFSTSATLGSISDSIALGRRRVTLSEAGTMRVESIHGAEGVLTVRCMGTVGSGSESTGSMRLVVETLDGWMRENHDQAVREIVVDFSDVDYRWGDAPLACFLPLIRKGVQRVRFLPGPNSASALESLLAAANIPWFSVERPDA